MDDVTLNQIRTDGGTQARAGLNEETVAEYLQAMKELAVFPPLIIFYDGQDYWLADGFHRLEALKRWGVHRPGRHLLDIRQGTQRDAVLFACGANATHGLKRSNEDKRRAVARLLQDEEWATWADREIARRCNVSAPFVGQMRQELGVVVEERTYTTKHGTVATMTTPQKPTALVEPPDGYVLCDDIGLYSLCPTCGHKAKSEPNRPVRFSGYEFCQEIQCLNCGHEFLKLTIGSVLRCYHLPNSGKKPEVEIGGQELQNVGGQEEFQPPAGYVKIKTKHGFLEGCPRCRKMSYENYSEIIDNCIDFSCRACGLGLKQILGVGYFYLPNSGKKPEVEIGGQETPPADEALVEPPGEYKNWLGWKRVITSKKGDPCPNCGEYGRKTEKLNLPDYNYSIFFTCYHCGHHQLVAGNNDSHSYVFGETSNRYVFHLPPEGEIGGQEANNIGGQEEENESCPCGCNLENPDYCAYASKCASCGGKYYAAEGHVCPNPENKYLQAILYLEKLMRSDVTSEVDPEGVLLDEIINEVYSGESLLDVLLSLMGEPA